MFKMLFPISEHKSQVTLLLNCVRDFSWIQGIDCEIEQFIKVDKVFRMIHLAVDYIKKRILGSHIPLMSAPGNCSTRVCQVRLLSSSLKMNLLELLFSQVGSNQLGLYEQISEILVDFFWMTLLFRSLHPFVLQFQMMRFKKSFAFFKFWSWVSVKFCTLSILFFDSPQVGTEQYLSSFCASPCTRCFGNNGVQTCLKIGCCRLVLQVLPF